MILRRTPLQSGIDFGLVEAMFGLVTQSLDLVAWS